MFDLSQLDNQWQHPAQSDGDGDTDAAEIRLDIQLLEERIAPGRILSFWSTSGDADDRPTEEVQF